MKQQGNEMFKVIADNMIDTIVVVDYSGIVSYVSPSLEQLSGYIVDEYMGKNAFELIHPDDRESVSVAFENIVSTRESDDVEYRVTHKNGNIVFVETRVKPVFGSDGSVDYVVAVVRDMTARRKTELMLEESEQRFKSLFENNLDGVFSIDLEGYNIVQENSAFERITGISADKLPNRCLLGVIHDEDHGCIYEALFHVTRNNQSQDLECRIIGPFTDRMRTVQITFVPILRSGECLGVHGIVKDITARVSQQQELVRSEARSQYLRQSLNRLSSDLASVMKVADLERRLIEEVTAVLGVQSATIVEGILDEKTSMDPSRRIRIGDKRELVVDLKSPLEKMEEEWLETAVRYVTILYDNLHLIEDLMTRIEQIVSSNETPGWMLRLLFQLSEKERASLSSDLHDSVLQDLIIWYRKLESARSSALVDESMRKELQQIEGGILDAIHQIRITCNELRPPFLLKMGLNESLRSLLEYVRMFANYEIEFEAEPMSDMDMTEEQILGIYRIVQELLNNANKHSQATKVTMSLESGSGEICFAYRDDGVGIDLSTFANSFEHMGISGIEKRVQSLDGTMELMSAPGRGFHVAVRLPRKQIGGERYGDFAG